MHAKPFEYVRAESIDHAIKALSEHDDALILAGGHGLIPELKKRALTPSTIVDIGSLDSLAGIDRRESTVRIGALSTHTEVRNSSLLTRLVPVFPRTVARITGGRQVHNFATIGGNIARAHPGYDYEAALLATKSTVVVCGPAGTEAVPAADFFRGALQTSLTPTQLVTGIDVPLLDGPRGGGYAKRKEPGSGNAIVGVAADLQFATDARDVIESARVAVNGLQESAVRLTATEERLTGANATAATIERAGAVAGESIAESEVLDNKKASAPYRLGLLESQVQRALTEATTG